jgi:hypothetical protein
MSLWLAEVYDALRAADVPEKVARDAASAMGELTADMRLLKWMVATNVGLSLVLLGAIGGLYLRLADLASRIPR